MQEEEEGSTDKGRLRERSVGTMGEPRKLIKRESAQGYKKRKNLKMGVF